MKELAYTIAFLAVFFIALALVQDPEPPVLIISAEIPPLQCPVQDGCSSIVE